MTAQIKPKVSLPTLLKWLKWGWHLIKTSVITVTVEMGESVVTSVAL